MSYIGPLTQELLNTFAREFKKKETKSKITKNIIDPLANEIAHRCYPYMFAHLAIQIAIILLLVYIISILRAN